MNSSNIRNNSPKVLEINSDNIELYKILKLEGWSGSGGSAKLFIAEGLVSVNGEVETRKRKKIIAGDLIEFNGETISIRRKNETS
ncbi:MAG: ribosome-associated protein [Gammaproteobacteria bacterium]|jgi:ribosome-associated protein